MEKELSPCRVWLYARIPGDYVGTMDSIKVCALQAHADGCTVVGSSTDEHGGWLLRPGYREMLRHIRKGEIDTVYICRMRHISRSEGHLFSFFRQLMKHGVKVVATEYNIEYRAANFKLGRKIDTYAARHQCAKPFGRWGPIAYTKIKAVKHHLQRCLDYTSNPNKTEKFADDDLRRLLSYTQNQDKTEHQLYVTGFHCDPETACMSMELTKRLWEQPTDKGVLAYHIIQSFSPGEATPDQVHEIGCEFARRFLADRFECTVSTHLDKGHLHNHIVVNSVSYADGKMFRNNFDTYYHGIRQVSDELCRENRLSVIETDGKGKSYDEWLSGQSGKPTIRGMVRKDVEQAIAAADSFDGFILELQNMGYTVKYGPRVEHMAVRHKDAQRNIRIDRLDPRFSETALREYYHKLHRMPTEMQQEYRQENAPAKPKWQPTELQPTVRRARYRGKLPRRYPKVSGFMACYYHYCALLRKAYHGKATKRCYFLLREDFLLFSRYQQQTKFLWENHIETMDELLAYKENAEVQIQQLARQRKVLYRQKHEPERAAREEKIKSLTQQMKVLRHEVYICSDIETDAADVQEKLRQAELAAQEERNEVKQDEQRRRSSRSDGAGSLTGYRSSH